VLMLGGGSGGGGAQWVGLAKNNLARQWEAW
jgi:hypothetical protein